MRVINEVLLVLFVIVFLFSGFMIIKPLFDQDLSITGHATSGTAVSNVTVSKSFSINLGANLSSGILFGNVSGSLAMINGSSNYDGTAGTNESTYFVNVSDDASINVDFCISANADLKSSGNDVISLNNQTYSNDTSTNGTEPKFENQAILTSTDAKAGVNFAPDSFNYFRFWLNITSTVPSGDYNNTITFTGKETGAAC